MSNYATESFNVDHTAMPAPQIRVAGRYERDGVIVSKLDIRFCKPNVDVLPREAMHTIEHLFAEVAHSTNKDIIDFSPMGCGTGFYLTFFGEPQPMISFVLKSFEECLRLPSIPAVNPRQCGSYRLHDLAAARTAISDFLNNIF